MSEFGPRQGEHDPRNTGSWPTELDVTQPIPKVAPGQPDYPRETHAAPSLNAGIAEHSVARTQQIPVFDPESSASSQGAPLPPEVSPKEPHDQDRSPWHNTLTAANIRARDNDETAEGVFASSSDPRLRPLGEKVLVGLRRTAVVAITVAAMATVGLVAKELSKLGPHPDDRDDALPAPTALPFLPTSTPTTESPSPSVSPSPSRAILLHPVPKPLSPSPTKTSASPSPSPSPSLSPSPSISESTRVSASPSQEVNTCTPSGSASETAICMPRGGTAYAYEWPPEAHKTVYAVHHGQVVRPECINSEGWVLADSGDQAGYLQSNYFQQDDLRLIGACAN